MTAKIQVLQGFFDDANRNFLFLLTFFRVRKCIVLGAVLTQMVRTLLELLSEKAKTVSQGWGAEFVSKVSETSASTNFLLITSIQEVQ